MQTPNKKQLRWACRRGMLELDQFLLTFFDDCYDDLSENDQKTFELLLGEQDQDLFNWLLNVSVSPDPQFQVLCDKIRAHAQQVL
jgi:antitoxin CptB